VSRREVRAPFPASARRAPIPAGGGTPQRCVIAAVLLLAVLAFASGGLRASTTAQLLLVSLLTAAVIVAAVVGAAPAARGANWLPFAGRSLGRAGRSPGAGSERRFLAVIAVTGVILLALYGAGLVTTAELVGVPTTLFLVVYLCCTLSAARTLPGTARACAIAAFAAVAVLLAFCGWALVFAAVVAIGAALYGGRRRPAV
jgi:amino acid efflux transporter